MYETFDHTADVGIRIRADTLSALFADAGRGLFSLIVENLADVRPVNEIHFTVEGDDPALLLFDWLAELLYVFETRHVLLVDFTVALSGRGLSATGRGEPYDPARHQLDHEVKAITYHGLDVREVDQGWEGVVIVDI